MSMRRLLACVLLAVPPVSAWAFDPADAWPRYRQQQSLLPLIYERAGEEAFDGGIRRRFSLNSQRWPSRPGEGGEWMHRVEVLVPHQYQPGPALLVINNGVLNGGGPRPPAPADDMAPEMLEALARQLGMVVVSVADVPEQALQLPGDDQLRVEDDLVALSWRRFLDDPAGHALWPLQVPMAEAAIRAMDLAQWELTPAQAPSFIVAGASKRGWAAWMLPLVDDRVSHLMPFVIDMHWEALAPHIQRSYGGRWPIALFPYWQHGVTGAFASAEFAALMQVIDPYRYLEGPLHSRLEIPKYLVSASGDDFFPPDASRFYLSRLPGETSVRVAPNADHGGIRRFMASSMLPALTRWRRGQDLARVHAQWWSDALTPEVHVHSSERPVKAVLWTARNDVDRDFRYACGIRYEAKDVALPELEGLVVALPPAETGWVSAFVELHYADGFVATSAAHVYPQNRYPKHPPAQGEGRCKLVAGP